MELPHPLQINVQLRKLHLLIQHFMISQLRHTTFITQSLKEIHSGRETGLIDTGPLTNLMQTHYFKKYAYIKVTRLTKTTMQKVSNLFRSK